MLEFRLKLKPSSPHWEFTNKVPVYLNDRKTFIGTCEIDLQESGTWGIFELTRNVNPAQFVTYDIKSANNELESIIIVDATNRQANTIGNSLV